jgi:hypothetical protein
MNLVTDKHVKTATCGQENNIKMVVIGGKSINMPEALE